MAPVLQHRRRKGQPGVCRPSVQPAFLLLQSSGSTSREPDIPPECLSSQSLISVPEPTSRINQPMRLSHRRGPTEANPVLHTNNITLPFPGLPGAHRASDILCGETNLPWPAELDPGGSGTRPPPAH